MDIEPILRKPLKREQVVHADGSEQHIWHNFYVGTTGKNTHWLLSANSREQFWKWPLFKIFHRSPSYFKPVQFVNRRFLAVITFTKRECITTRCYLQFLTKYPTNLKQYEFYDSLIPTSEIAFHGSRPFKRVWRFQGLLPYKYLQETLSLANSPVNLTTLWKIQCRRYDVEHYHEFA